jgi:tetratricopeptide (TPR) repeat protein
VLGWQDEEFQAFSRAVALARQADDHTLRSLYVTLEAYHQWLRSDYRASSATAEEGKRLTLEAGDAYHYMSCLYFQASALLHLGEWDDGLRAAREGLELAEKNGHLMATRVYRYTLSWFHEQAFDYERARELCALAVSRTDAGQFDLYLGLIRLGMAHLGLRDLDAAHECLREVTDRLERGATMDWIWHMHLHHALGEYWLARGDPVRAQRDAEETRARADQWGERTYQALARRTLAEVALARHDWDQAEAELSQALLLLDGNELPLAEWRVHATAAQLHRRRRCRTAANQSRARSLAVLRRLANSLGPDDTLRQHMLNNLPK